MITCPKCSKDNQDHYKFCLGCGAELPRDVAPKPFSPQTPPQGMKAVQAPGPVAPPGPVAAPPAVVLPPAPPIPAGAVPLPGVPPTMASAGGGLGATVAISQPIAPPRPAAPASAAAPPVVAASMPAPVVPANVVPPLAASSAIGGGTVVSSTGVSVPPGEGTVTCPQCGHVNAPQHLFCGSCGFRLGGAAPRPAAPAPAPAEPTSGAGVLVLTALRADGSEAGTYPIPNATGAVGRETGGIFAGDSYLSPRHATFRSAGPGKAVVKDEGSLNGVYKKLGRDVPIEIKPNDVFRIGQEIIKFEPLVAQPPASDGVERLGAPSKGYIGRIALVIGRDETGNAFPIPEGGVHMGRERGEILFPEDGYVSGLHCRLTWDGKKLLLTDLGSSNGTFVRIRGESDIRGGDVLLMGQQLFRVAL